MLPVVTAAQMRAADAAAPEDLEVLVLRAGAAVGRAALRMLGGGYGSRVVVVAGKGNNGADGKVAARWLERRGVRVQVFDAADAPPLLPASDLVIDAAFGTGFRGAYDAPDPGGARVLAVDIPSGIDGDTGVASGRVARADATVTFAAWKPGLLLADGPAHAGRVEVADIGLDVGAATCHLVEERDLVIGLPAKERTAHKWAAGVFVVAGSGGMMGAASLTARATLRAGATTTRLAVPGADDRDLPVSEVVGRALPASGWHTDALEDMDRFKVLVVGPGLGRTEATRASLLQIVEHAPIPVVIDADGITLLGDDAEKVLGARSSPTVVTPHDKEFERVSGAPPGPDRIGDAVALARRLGATVLLKGPTTVIADPHGQVLLSASGSPRLATAGTGDVLAGMIGAFAARGLDLPRAAAYAAFAHGQAARLGFESGLVAGDLLDLVPHYLSSLS